MSLPGLAARVTPAAFVTVLAAPVPAASAPSPQPSGFAIVMRLDRHPPWSALVRVAE
jgi:hypothetical protein